MAQYPVLEPLAHDRTYAPGEIVDLSDQDAALLQKAKVIGEAIAEEAPPSGAGANKPQPAAELIALIKKTNLIGALDNLAAGETRKTVLEAIEARRQELETKP